MKSSLGIKDGSLIKTLGSGLLQAGSNYLGQKGKVASAIPSNMETHSIGSLSSVTQGSNSVNSKNMPMGLKKCPLEK